MRRAVRRSLWVLGVLAGLALVGVFVMFGPPGLAARFAKPSFCASCHIMEPMYTGFTQSPHANLESCNECHLPNQNVVSHYVADGVVGMRDVIYWNFGIGARRPIDVRPTGWTGDVVQANCRRCHTRLVSHVDIGGRRCWDCHRTVFHRWRGPKSGWEPSQGGAP